MFKVGAVQRGDMTAMEKVLVAQAHSLGALFLPQASSALGIWRSEEDLNADEAHPADSKPRPSNQRDSIKR